jgi:hypothetical protein
MICLPKDVSRELKLPQFLAETHATTENEFIALQGELAYFEAELNKTIFLF